MQHAVEAEKCADPTDAANICANKYINYALTVSCGFSRKRPAKSNWQLIKMQTLFKFLKVKFSRENPHLRQRLKETIKFYLVNGNMIPDQEMGSCYCAIHIFIMGKNILVLMLMKLRDDIINEDKQLTTASRSFVISTASSSSDDLASSGKSTYDYYAPLMSRTSSTASFSAAASSRSYISTSSTKSADEYYDEPLIPKTSLSASTNKKLDKSYVTDKKFMNFLNKIRKY